VPLQGCSDTWTSLGGLRLSLPSKVKVSPFYFFESYYLGFCPKSCLSAWLKSSFTGFSCVSWFMLTRWTITVLHTGLRNVDFVRWSVYILPMLDPIILNNWRLCPDKNGLRPSFNVIGDRDSGHQWSVMWLSTFRSRDDGNRYSVIDLQNLSFIYYNLDREPLSDFCWP
jgi:hypothetical protein